MFQLLIEDKSEQSVGSQILFENPENLSRGITEESLMNLANRFHEKMTENEIRELLSSCDFNHDGSIDESDFTKIMKRTNFQ
jgi:Ca2+-binding EF-hand superfamily protein